MSDVSLKNISVTNPLNEPFVHRWDGTWYELPASKTVSMVGYLAEHMAKHLAVKILNNKGRFKDVLSGDKRIGTAVTSGEIQHVMEALLNRDGSVLDIDEVLAIAKKADPVSKDLPDGAAVVRIEEAPLRQEVVVKEDAPVDNNLLSRWKELLAKGYNETKGAERIEYKELKRRFAK